MRVRMGLAALAMAAALAGCQQKKEKAEFGVERAWVRLSAVMDQPGAAYFTLHAGPAPVTLVKVEAPFAVRTEMHESMTGEHNMSTMTPLKSVIVDAGEDVEFKPGGKHVMLFDMAPKVVAGQTVPLTLQFADGKSVPVQAKVVGAGDPPPFADK